jgi:hypothetical protein
MYRYYHGLFHNKTAWIFGGFSHLRTRSNILFKKCTAVSCSPLDPLDKARYNWYDRGGRPYKGTHHVIIHPRMSAAGPVLMVGLKGKRKNYRQRQRSAVFYNPFISQDLDNSSARRKRFGWNYKRLASFLGHLNTDDYVTVLSGSTQKFQERKFEDNRQ